MEIHSGILNRTPLERPAGEKERRIGKWSVGPFDLSSEPGMYGWGGRLTSGCIRQSSAVGWETYKRSMRDEVWSPPVLMQVWVGWYTSRSPRESRAFWRLERERGVEAKWSRLVLSDGCWVRFQSPPAKTWVEQVLKDPSAASIEFLEAVVVWSAPEGR